MDPDPEPVLAFLSTEALNYGHLIGLLALLFLLVASALISGSEVAFFTHRNEDAEDDDRMNELLDNPKKLLATILVSNNFINVGIVILSAFIIDELFDFSENALAGIIIQLVVITFILLLFGEVLPKVYASRRPGRFSSFVLPGIFTCYKIFLPLSRLLAKSTNVFNEKGGNGQSISVDDLSQALELAGGDKTDANNKMLVDIVKFGNTTVKQIMTPRPDMVALSNDSPFDNVLELIRNAGYSRLPIHGESLDEIIGLLYIKDLLEHTDKKSTFAWTDLIRPAFFVPESKKIDDLLQEFRAKKIHLAIVVDEYGGTSGLVTLEDIIEEVVGEINDEFDLEDNIYSKVDDQTFVFEGKTPLHEFLRILHIENNEPFDQAKGDSDTLAGFIIERTGELPQVNQSFTFENIEFTVDAMENRRIQRINVKLLPHESTD